MKAGKPERQAAKNNQASDPVIKGAQLASQRNQPANQRSNQAS
jgi:hypothetical protein